MHLRCDALPLLEVGDKTDRLLKVEDLINSRIIKANLGEGISLYHFTILALPPDYYITFPDLKERKMFRKKSKRFIYTCILKDYARFKKLSINESDKVLFSYILDSARFLSELKIENFDVASFIRLVEEVGQENHWI